MLNFKSEAHRTMLLRMVALQLRCNLLRRFGGVRQEECRLLRSPPARQLLLHWAADIVDRLPHESAAQSAFVAHESARVPSHVLRHPAVEPLIQENQDLRWLVARLEADEAHVPKPYFPSVLRHSLPQFPFAPHEIDKARHLYGLLKFPFYRLTADVRRCPSERFAGLREPVMPNECTVPGEHDMASDCITHDGGKLASADYVYAPSELETGLDGKAHAGCLLKIARRSAVLRIAEDEACDGSPGLQLVDLAPRAEALEGAPDPRRSAVRVARPAVLLVLKQVNGLGPGAPVRSEEGDEGVNALEVAPRETLGVELGCHFALPLLLSKAPQQAERRDVALDVALR
ncbi:uncharacterized protein BcabD6B2_09490 [Babesia caballi]|uniref:Uncharacterized protein n=1 Tax=Babesia caballi TaxID=5871 RepID=A0AAV4LSE5_BABCB|nr:hypothetical protein, conserved [Babesia caballi]